MDDLLKHLRATNLLLVLTCLALLVPFAFLQTSTVGQARDELAIVRHIAQNWSTLWKEYARGVSRDLTVSPLSEHVFLETPEGDVAISVRGNVSPWILETGSWKSYVWENSLGEAEIHDEALETLDAFVQRWNELVTARHEVYVAIRIDRIWRDKSGETGKDTRWALSSSRDIVQNLQLRLDPNLRINNGHVYACEGGFYCRVSLVESKNEVYPKEFFAKLLPSDVAIGTFPTTFPYLSVLGKEYGNVPLERADSLLASQVHDKTISVVGIAVPTSTIAAWALPILVVLQFVFALHLDELRRRLRRGETLGSTEWLALYESRLARFAFLVGTVAFPIATGLFIAVRNRATIPSWSTVAIGCVVAAWSTVLYVRTVRVASGSRS